MAIAEDLSFRLVRSDRRKTLGLQVKNGEIIVRAPHRLPETFIHQFINEKQAWLRAKVQLQLEQVSNNDEVPTFRHQSQLLVHGVFKTIFVSVAAKSEVTLDNDHLYVTISNRQQIQLINEQTHASCVKRLIELYFKQHAQTCLPKRVAELSAQTALFPSDIVIKRYRARWGSCNSRGQLSFNYLLMMCPSWVIDYVIIHELCHLAYLNHSSHFWSLVEQHLPDYRQAKRWLKTNQSFLSF